MPTQFHGFMSRDELAQAQMGRFLSHTYNIPVYKVPQVGRPPLRHRDVEGDALDTVPPPGRFMPAAPPREGYEPGHELYDLTSDPGQERPIRDDALEARFEELLRAQLRRVSAPEEHLARLGL
jgi:hypothetical protein